VAGGLPPVVRGTTIDDNLTIPIGALTSMAVVAAVIG
jgi:dolichol kinase